MLCLKAHDHVNWNLLNFLKGMGFSEKCISWMFFDTKIVKFSILVNGYTEKPFHAVRGLRQGNPLSPFLFLIAMEGLKPLFKVVKDNGVF